MAKRSQLTRYYTRAGKYTPSESCAPQPSEQPNAVKMPGDLCRCWPIGASPLLRAELVGPLFEPSDAASRYSRTYRSRRERDAIRNLYVFCTSSHLPELCAPGPRFARRPGRSVSSSPSRVALCVSRRADLIESTVRCGTTLSISLPHRSR